MNVIEYVQNHIVNNYPHFDFDLTNESKREKSKIQQTIFHDFFSSIEPIFEEDDLHSRNWINTLRVYEIDGRFVQVVWARQKPNKKLPFEHGWKFYYKKSMKFVKQIEDGTWIPLNE
jgi:hypothetical protein